ncbi:glycosyltransferase 87 family protein [Ktedonospora formicarum]|nr:glycosyltransferase 87 family protein [Ktedonospora formicarum]
MSLLQASESAESVVALQGRARARWRFPLLIVLLLVMLAYFVVVRLTAPAADTPVDNFLLLYMGGFLPYGLACAVVFCTPAPQGRWRWLELGSILLAGLVMRALLLPLEPDLSRDSWRYLWDARVTLLGYSPYAYVPADPRFHSIQDFLFVNSRYRFSPALYPPGAQGVFLISYLLAPSNLPFLKGMFVLMDLVTSGGIAYLLARRGVDWSRCLLYALCPVPIIEFALQGHVDACPVVFSVLAVIFAQETWKGSRVVTGLCIALATLTKLYPILLLVVLVRRRDWALVLTCFVTIVAAYLPYVIMGHGQIFGFFSTYASEQQPNAGPVYLLLTTWEATVKGSWARLVFFAVEGLVMGGAVLAVLWLRWHRRIGIEAGLLVLYGVIFAVSSHIFPWYTPTLLPWVALLLGFYGGKVKV